MTERLTRVQMIVQMLETYGIDDPTEGRLRGYLAVLEGIPTERLGPAIERAMQTATWCPVPGEVYRAHRELGESGGQAGPELPRDAGPRLGRGTRAALPAQAAAGGFERRVRHPQASELFARAAEVRSTPRVPASPLRNRTLSYIAAAVELGVEWPLREEHARILDTWMHEHERDDPDASCAWWWEERERPTVTARRAA